MHISRDTVVPPVVATFCYAILKFLAVRSEAQSHGILSGPIRTVRAHMGAILWQFHRVAAGLAYMYGRICSGISHHRKLRKDDYTWADTGPYRVHTCFPYETAIGWLS